MSSQAGSEHTQNPVETLGEGLARLADQGLDASKVNEFGELLKKCNILSLGALRAFHESLDELVSTMFDKTQIIEKLQADGFVAAVRVCAIPPLPNPHP